MRGASGFPGAGLCCLEHSPHTPPETQRQWPGTRGLGLRRRGAQEGPLGRASRRDLCQLESVIVLAGGWGRDRATSLPQDPFRKAGFHQPNFRRRGPTLGIAYHAEPP